MSLYLSLSLPHLIFTPDLMMCVQINHQITARREKEREREEVDCACDILQTQSTYIMCLCAVSSVLDPVS